jgi:amino acid transporter
MADVTDDEALLASFGYKQELTRKLRFGSLLAISFSVISITTGIFLNYGFGLENFGPAAIWTWPIAVVGQLFVAFVVAELGTRIPLAGYSYQWGRRLVGSGYGWLLGWTALLYMWAGGAAIALLVTAPTIASIFGWHTGNQRLMLFIGILLVVLALLVNVISVQLTARVNNVAVVAEILGIVGFAVAVFFAWVAKAKPDPHGASILGAHPHTGLVGFAIAGLLGIFTIVGFEFAADMAEETVNPRRIVPRAIIGAVAASGVLGMVALVGFTIAIPDIAMVTKSSLPLITISHYWLGTAATKVFLVIVAFATFAVLTVGTTAQARLLYSMGRDNVILGSRFLRLVHPKTKTPVVGLIVAAILTIAFMVYGYNQASAFGTLTAAASIFPYLAYGLIVAAYAARSKRLPEAPRGVFSLGRFRATVFVVAGGWLVLALVVLTVPAQFRGADWVVLGGEFVAGLWYLFGIRRRQKRGIVDSADRLEANAPGSGDNAPESEASGV